MYNLIKNDIILCIKILIVLKFGLLLKTISFKSVVYCPEILEKVIVGFN